jgi:hypothetical protein
MILAATAPGYQSAAVQIQIGDAATPLAITTLALATGQTGAPYSQQLTAIGGTAPYKWSLASGTLPSGLTLSQSGLLGGATATPVAALSLTFRVTDSGAPAQTTATTFALTIAAPATPASVAATGGTPQTAVRNALFALPLMATVFDIGGKPLQGVAVTFQAPAQGPSGAFSGGGKTFVATTNINGLAAAAFTANGEAGSYAVTARVTGVATPAIFQLTNTTVALPGITLLAPPGLAVGARAQVALLLATPAPPGGLTLQLETSDPTTAVLNQSSTFIPEGQVSTGRPSLLGLRVGTVTITVSAPGYTSASGTVQVLAP